MSTLEEIQQKIDFVQTNIDFLTTQIEPLQDSRVKLIRKLAKLREKADKIRVEQFKAVGGINPEIVVSKTHFTDSGPILKEREKQGYELGLYASGGWHETQQGAVKIMLKKGCRAKTEQTFESLKFLLPHILPLKDGFKPVDIFEYNLSEFGNYRLGIEDDADSKTVLFRNEKVDQTFLNLWDALIYCEKHHYYTDYADD